MCRSALAIPAIGGNPCMPDRPWPRTAATRSDLACCLVRLDWTGPTVSVGTCRGWTRHVPGAQGPPKSPVISVRPVAENMLVRGAGVRQHVRRGGPFR